MAALHTRPADEAMAVYRYRAAVYLSASAKQAIFVRGDRPDDRYVFRALLPRASHAANRAMCPKYNEYDKLVLAMQREVKASLKRGKL